jgi:hypothetical protein
MLKARHEECVQCITQHCHIEVIFSQALRKYIFSELAPTLRGRQKKFNPEGWFGATWTRSEDPSKNERHFRDEYCDVLRRSDDEPYSYNIRPEYIQMIREIFADFGLPSFS